MVQYFPLTNGNQNLEAEFEGNFNQSSEFECSNIFSFFFNFMLALILDITSLGTLFSASFPRNCISGENTNYNNFSTKHNTYPKQTIHTGSKKVKVDIFSSFIVVFSLF